MKNVHYTVENMMSKVSRQNVKTVTLQHEASCFFPSSLAAMSFRSVVWKTEEKCNWKALSGADRKSIQRHLQGISKGQGGFFSTAARTEQEDKISTLYFKLANSSS